MLDRIAVTFLAAIIAFFGPIVLFLAARSIGKWRWAAENASLEPLLWLTGIVAAGTFLMTFFDRPSD